MAATAESNQALSREPQAVPEVLHKTETAYALDRTGYTASGRQVPYAFGTWQWQLTLANTPFVTL